MREYYEGIIRLTEYNRGGGGGRKKGVGGSLKVKREENECDERKMD
jgi:hypothetical protein